MEISLLSVIFRDWVISFMIYFFVTYVVFFIVDIKTKEIKYI